jgi:hypothetical protein
LTYEPETDLPRSGFDIRRVVNGRLWHGPDTHAYGHVHAFSHPLSLAIGHAHERAGKTHCHCSSTNTSPYVTAFARDNRK